MTFKFQLTDNSGGDVDDGAGHVRGDVATGDEEQLDGEVFPAGRVFHLCVLVAAVAVPDLLALSHLHQLLHLAAGGGEVAGLVPARSEEGGNVSWAGGTVDGDTEDRKQGSLILPEDEDADGHQGVGKQCPNGHEVHQRCQVKQEGHQSCRERRSTVR